MPLLRQPAIAPDEPFEDSMVVLLTEQLIIFPSAYPTIPPIYKHSSFDILLSVTCQLKIVPYLRPAMSPTPPDLYSPTFRGPEAFLIFRFLMVAVSAILPKRPP